MKTTDDIVDTLKNDMQDAADEAQLLEFMKEMATLTKIMAEKHKFAPDMAAYGLARVACAIADTDGNRQPVMVALATSWPEIFQEITEEEFNRMRDEIRQRDR